MHLARRPYRPKSYRTNTGLEVGLGPERESALVDMAPFVATGTIRLSNIDGWPGLRLLSLRGEIPFPVGSLLHLLEWLSRCNYHRHCRKKPALSIPNVDRDELSSIHLNNFSYML